MTIEAVLCDRDGTLLVDVPYNGDPARVLPMPTVAEGLERLRAEGLKLGVVSNQAGVAQGLLTEAAVEAVMARMQEVLGPFDTVLWCPHGPDDGCGCRKPAPGMVKEAARQLDVDPTRCALIGDTGADVDAAQAAGAVGVMVPTERTRLQEVGLAPVVAPSFVAAVNLLLR